MLVSGTRRAFERGESVLRVFGGNTTYLGEDAGAASAMDLATLSYVYGSILGFFQGANRSKEYTQVSANIFGEVLENDLNKGQSGLSLTVIRDALRAVSRLKGRSVEVEVPRELAKEIAAGRLFRNGGVVRDAGGKIRAILKDPSKASTLLKGPALALAAIDFAQSVMLNEKLKEIQDQLRSVENKLDSLVHSKLHSAFEEAAQIPHFKRPAERNKRFTLLLIT